MLKTLLTLRAAAAAVCVCALLAVLCARPHVLQCRPVSCRCGTVKKYSLAFAHIAPWVDFL